jgi:hypothetical protein
MYKLIFTFQTGCLHMTSMTSCWLRSKVVNNISRIFFSLLTIVCVLYVHCLRLSLQWTYNTHTIVSKLKKIREMLLTTLERNQHDVIDVI